LNKFRKAGFVAYESGALSVYSSLLTLLVREWRSNCPSLKCVPRRRQNFAKTEQF
jgi:hypothetical protein